MKQSLHKDTLAYQLGVRPGLQFRDMSAVPVPQVVDRLNIFMENKTFASMVGLQGSEPPMGYPEQDGLMFYLLNHASSIIRQRVHPYEKLGKYLPIMDAYHESLAYRSARMFFYMLLICTRESRHDKNGHSSPFWKVLSYKYPGAMEFHKTIKGGGSDGAATKLRENPPQMTIGKYTEFLAEIFHEGQYSGGYGGPAWGAVADVLRDYVHGKLTAEMMMDTAFTLCHNNGPIFNKGMLFHQYTKEILTILDVQRSGQIPQMIGNKETKWANGGLFQTWQNCNDVLEGAFEGYVDWFLVEELGALHGCKPQQQAQVAKYGYPSKFKAKVEAEKIKTDLKAKQEAKEAKMWVEIMPGIKVKKVEVRT